MNYSLGENIAYSIINFSEGDFGIKSGLAKAAVVGSIGLSALTGGYLGNKVGNSKMFVSKPQRAAITKMDKAADNYDAQSNLAILTAVDDILSGKKVETDKVSNNVKSLTNAADLLRGQADDFRKKETSTSRKWGTVIGSALGAVGAAGAASAVKRKKKYNKAYAEILEGYNKSN